MKNQNLDPHKALEVIKKIENMAGLPAFDLSDRQDIKVKIRVSEQVGPGKFKPDPLIPGGYVANSLTVRAMRPDIFVLGNSLEDFSASYLCSCGQEIDVQFWYFCPFCAREFKL
ncbi:MAG TPA: hypothetical protein VNJ01_09455 [Bacteriovoracaceae bacterium]|nr:hypothetical protein [Bacteriovoracaceae bacterium]